MKNDMNKRRLVFSMVQFLNREMTSDDISEDAKEGLEVASQCLQTAYCLAPEDTHLEVRKTLETLFEEATQNEPMKMKSPPTDAEKEEADKLKLEGNELMRTEQYEAAVDRYTRAIELDGSNQVFYCNRAAAHSKMDNHYSAVEDCQRAIDMDPKYGKAYGRMGLAYSSINKHKEAVECFKKAIEIEPDNESYKTNLKVAEEKLATTSPAAATGAGGLFPGAGGFDLGNLLGNPNLMNMATSMMSDPNMQQLMAQFASGGGGAAAAQGVGNMDEMLRAGQRFAEQMQQSNPDLVEQLRRQMGGGGENTGTDSSKPPPK